MCQTGDLSICLLSLHIFLCSLVLWLPSPLSIFPPCSSSFFNYLPRTLGSSSIPTFNSVRDYILTRLSHIIWFQFHSKCGNSPAALVMNMVQVGCIIHCYFLYFFSKEFKQREINKLWGKKMDLACLWKVLVLCPVTSGASPVIHFLSCHCFCSWIASRYGLLNKNNILNWHAKVAAL